MATFVAESATLGISKPSGVAAGVVISNAPAGDVIPIPTCA